MLFRQLINRSNQAITYLVGDLASGEAMLIDPDPSQRLVVKALLNDCSLELKAELFTHQHDHQPTRQNAHDLSIGHARVRMLSTPGHTGADVCFLWRDRLFSGDTLHPAGCPAPLTDSDPGRWYDSVTRLLFSLPDETLVFPHHLSDGRTVSTISEERRRNPFFSGVTREGFIARLKTLAEANT